MLDSVFMKDIQAPFDARRFALPRQPLEGFAFSPAKPGRIWESRNNWQIKCKDSEDIVLDDLEPDVRRFCQKALEHMQANRLPIKNRYLYLTVDDRVVPAGRTHRRSGWHFDGMQGSEVPTPNPGCFQYLWCDHTPMHITGQAFQVKGLCRHTVNFFDSLANQVDESKAQQVQAGIAYLMSPYQMHRCTALPEERRRKVVRLSASHQPNTSVLMTRNPHMHYDYEIHSTSGEIPRGLKTLYANFRSADLQKAS